MADDCGRIAQKALDHMERAIDAGDMADARMLVAPFGVLVDKAQLLSGGATSRTESLTAEHAHALIDEVAARRAKAS
jgi:hypothetical protein